MDTFSHIANYLSGSCSPEETERLLAWRKASAANEAEFHRLKKVWEAAAPATFCPDAGLAWQKVQARLCSKEAPAEDSRQEQPAARSRWLLTTWSVAAAVALLALSLGVYLLSGKQETFIPDGLTKHATSIQEKQELLLADGSRVWLNQQSKIYCPEQFMGSSREVYLEGEAFFEVSHQPEKPFIVHTEQSRIEVLGTSFNLQSGSTTQLQLTTGRLAFSSARVPQKALILEAGEAIIQEGEKLSKTAIPANYLAWKTGEFLFTDTPLEEVFRLLEQYYPVKLKTANPALLQCRLNARFSSQPLEEVLEVISLTFQLEYQQKDKEILFRGSAKNCRINP